MSEFLQDAHAEHVPEIQVVKLADGLGMDYKTGTISATELEQKEGNEDLGQLTDEAIASANILTPVSTDERGDMLDDDGCGDGRNVSAIFAYVDNVKHLFKRSLNRAKVFGGGLVMATAARIGFGEAQGQTLNEAMVASKDTLADKEIDFGAHTDNHATGENCGCGAIDKAPLVVAVAAHFRNDIKATIMNNFSESAEDEQLVDSILDNYAAYAQEIADQPYSGRAVMKEIVDSGKLVKELADGHLETRVLLNTIKGYTVDQEYVRRVTGGRAQVFAVDVWRLSELASGLYNAPTEQRSAFLSELVYTLGTAAVLTKGDLPVYLIKPAQQLAPAL